METSNSLVAIRLNKTNASDRNINTHLIEVEHPSIGKAYISYMILKSFPGLVLKDMLLLIFKKWDDIRGLKCSALPTQRVWFMVGESV